MPEDTYESQYLALCQRFPGLRVECAWCKGGTRNSALAPMGSCRRCRGVGREPRPEAERLGALVEVAFSKGCSVHLEQDAFGVGCYLDGIYTAARPPRPWQALTAALTAAVAAALAAAPA